MKIEQPPDGWMLSASNIVISSLGVTTAVHVSINGAGQRSYDILKMRHGLNIASLAVIAISWGLVHRETDAKESEKR